MEKVEADDLPALHSFGAGLRRDHDAVVAGGTLRWSSGPVEEHVIRLKMLKRQMFGRANSTYSAAAPSRWPDGCSSITQE